MACDGYIILKLIGRVMRIYGYQEIESDTRDINTN